MLILKNQIAKIKHTAKGAKLIVVTKNQNIQNIQKIYKLGEREFGENRVKDLIEKKNLLPNDINWHMIGHLQTNKVKLIASFIHLIQSVDSIRLLEVINDCAIKHDRKINCLIQIKVSNEKSKYGFNTKDALELFSSNYQKKYSNIIIKGIMAMGSLTKNKQQTNQEFELVRSIFNQIKPKKKILSMGMSNDYKIAYQNGANMIRIGSLIFKADI